MVEVKNLALNLGKFSLKDISFRVKKGSTHIILGPSGAGKSSIILAILGLNQVKSGAIFLDSKDITKLEVNKRGFGYVPQNLALFPHMSVEQNISYGLKAKNIKDSKILQKLIDVAGIKNLLKRYPSSLSGGEKQRVALVRAVATLPKVLLLDEPFSALDVSLKKEMWQLLNELKESFKITTIMITHDLNEAFFLADTISVVIGGKVVQSGNKEEIFYKPKSVEIAKYLGIKNIFNAIAISEHLLKIDNFNATLKTDFKLKKDKAYTVLIRAEDIEFFSNSVENTLFGEYKTLEFEYYNIAQFKVAKSNATLEVVFNKKNSPTNYIYLPPKKILCYQK